MRILLATMTNMLFQIVSSVLAQSAENVVVGRVWDDENLLSEARSTRADVVMMQAKIAQNDEAVWALLYRLPTLKIVTIAGDGRSGFIHELRRSSRPLAELSSEALHAALRGDSGGLPN